MRCKRCKAMVSMCDEPLSEPTWYCRCGMDIEKLETNEKGEPGCSMNPGKITRIIREKDENAGMLRCLFKIEELKRFKNIDISDVNSLYVSDAKHCIGLYGTKNHKPYMRRGRLCYRAKRNYFAVRKSERWNILESVGLADAEIYDSNSETPMIYYSLNKYGLRWLSTVLGVHITVGD